MKKLVAMLLALLTFLTMTNVSMAESEPVKLVLLSSQDAVEHQVNYFNAQNKDIQIEFQFVSGGWQGLSQKLVTLIAGGAAPDLVFLSPTYLADYVGRGQLLDITEYVERDIPDKSNYVDGTWDAMSMNGRIYGVPKDTRTSMMWYNKRIFDELGLNYPCRDWENPWTIDEWIETMKKVSGHELDGVQTRGIRPDWRYCRMMNLFQAAGIKGALDEEGNAQYNAPAVVDIYQRFTDGVRDGYIAATSDLDAIAWKARFFNGYDAFCLSGHWSYQDYVESDDMGICVMPGGVSNYWNDMFCGLAATKNPDAVWEAMKFFVSEEYWDWAMQDQVTNDVAMSPLKSVNEKYADTLYVKIQGEDRECMMGYLENAVPYEPFPCYTELENLLKEKTSLFHNLEVEDVQAEFDDLNESYQEVLDEFYEEYGRI